MKTKIYVSQNGPHNQDVEEVIMNDYERFGEIDEQKDEDQIPY